MPTPRGLLRVTAALIFLVCSVVPVFAQYTDMKVFDDLGGAQEFARRRAELGKQLKDGTLVLFARKHDPEANHYREDNDFFYYTGLSEPGAVLVMGAKSGQTMIFEPQQSANTKRVYGANLLSLDAAARQKLGYQAVLPLTDLDVILGFLLADGGDLWLRLGFPDKADGMRGEVGADYAAEYSHPYGQSLPGDREAIKKLAERYPATHQRDVTPFIDAMRNIKTPQEIEILRRNGKLSAEGIRQGMMHAHPGIFEYQIEAEAAYVFRKGGAEGWAYPAIVGSGDHINYWHYFNDRAQIAENGLVVFDFAADLAHETMDITRTFNVSGKFTPDQAKWY